MDFNNFNDNGNNQNGNYQNNNFNGYQNNNFNGYQNNNFNNYQNNGYNNGYYGNSAVDNSKKINPPVIINIFAILISIVTAFLLIASAGLMSIRYGLLKGGSVDMVLKNLEVDNLMEDVFVEYFDDAVEEEFEYSLDIDYTNIIPKGMISRISDEMIDTVCTDKEADFTFMENYVEEISESTTNALIDAVLDEIEDASLYSRSDFMYNDELVFSLRGYGIDPYEIADEIYSDDEDINEKYLSKKHNRDLIKNAISGVVNEAVEEYFENNIEEINDSLNRQINEDDDISSIRESVEEVNNVLDGITIATNIVFGITIFNLIIIFVMYCLYIHSAFKTNGIVLLIAGIITSTIGLIFKIVYEYVVKDRLFESYGANEVRVDVVLNFITNIVNKTFVPYIIMGICYIVISIVFLIVSGKLKKRRINKYSNNNNFY